MSTITTEVTEAQASRVCPSCRRATSIEHPLCDHCAHLLPVLYEPDARQVAELERWVALNPPPTKEEERAPMAEYSREVWGTAVRAFAWAAVTCGFVALGFGAALSGAGIGLLFGLGLAIYPAIRAIANALGWLDVVGQYPPRPRHIWNQKYGEVAQTLGVPLTTRKSGHAPYDNGFRPQYYYPTR